MLIALLDALPIGDVFHTARVGTSSLMSGKFVGFLAPLEKPTASNEKVIFLR